MNSKKKMKKSVLDRWYVQTVVYAGTCLLFVRMFAACFEP